MQLDNIIRETKQATPVVKKEKAVKFPPIMSTLVKNNNKKPQDNHRDRSIGKEIVRETSSQVLDAKIRHLSVVGGEKDSVI